MNVNEWFDSLGKDYIETEGTRLLQLEEEWHDRVPSHMDRAAEKAIHRSRYNELALLLLPLGFKPGRVKKGGTFLPAGKIAAIALAGAVTATAGVYAASPSLRAELAPFFSGSTQQTETAAVPKGYQIPSPGDQFSVVENGEGDQVLYTWYASGEQAILVEVLNYFPEDMTKGGEAVSVGGLQGYYTEGGNAKTLVLQNGAVSFVVQASGVERSEIFAYAGQLVEVNK